MPSDNDNYVKIGASDKLVDGSDTPGGGPPDFAYVGPYGWEAAYQLAPGQPRRRETASTSTLRSNPRPTINLSRRRSTRLLIITSSNPARRPRQPRPQRRRRRRARRPARPRARRRPRARVRPSRRSQARAHRPALALVRQPAPARAHRPASAQAHRRARARRRPRVHRRVPPQVPARAHRPVPVPP